MGWNFDSNDNSSSKKADFTKFPEGITRVRVVGLEPHVRWVHWINSLRKSVNCPSVKCAICDVRKRQKQNGETETYGMSRRLAIWVLNRETNKLEILEQGVTFFEELRDIMEELSDDGKSLIDVDIKVKRKGNDKSTSYRITVDEEYPLSEADIKLTEDMFELGEYFRPTTYEQTLAVVNGASWDEIINMNNEEKQDVILK